MSGKIKIGILGATGMVGQNYLRLLENHPWFEVCYLAASPRSAGQKYEDAVSGKWAMDCTIPAANRDMIVEDASQIDKAVGRCSLIFSAVEMSKQDIVNVENGYAAKGFAVVSNNSAHRFTPDVPMIIPEINPEHLDVIPHQRKRNGWSKGLIAVKSNCSIQSYMAPLYALLKAGYNVDKMFVATLQALSGAGYPGVPSLDVVDNVIPYIGGEEEKSEKEPLKVLGKIENGAITSRSDMKITAHCNRVPVIDGHTACISLGFAGKKPTLEEIISLWRNFKALPQELKLPSAPEQPIIYLEEQNRPQPRRDRDADKAMAVSVGRLRACNLLDIRFVGLHHNTIRGAAGGAILTAELLKARGYLD